MVSCKCGSVLANEFRVGMSIMSDIKKQKVSYALKTFLGFYYVQVSKIYRLQNNITESPMSSFTTIKTNSQLPMKFNLPKYNSVILQLLEMIILELAGAVFLISEKFIIWLL